MDSATLPVSTCIPRSVVRSFPGPSGSAFSRIHFLLPATRADPSCPQPGQLCRALKGNTVSTKTTTRPPDTRAVRRRVSLTDRIALRVGMSLIIWSRRTRTVRPSLDHATVARLERERRQRELDWLTQVAALRMWR